MTSISEEQLKPTIGIITALPEEYAAIEVMLDRTKPFFMPAGRGVGRKYTFGEIPAIQNGRHYIVLGLADKGNNIAASRAAVLLERFPNVKWIIMVGIACGVPNYKKPDDHVRLGDIIVSGRKGIVKYDFVKETINEKIPDHPPRPPSAILYDAAKHLQIGALKGDMPWIKFIKKGLKELGKVRPSEKTDILYHSTETEKIIPHPKDPNRIKNHPRIFIGTIASADTVLKNPIKRDKLRDKFGVSAVEMEGSGIADAAWDLESDYFVVRGSCDYGDHSKGDVWHMYAAIVAAAYTRALLESIPGYQIEGESDANERENQQYHSLHFITPPDPGFVGRKEILRKIKSWYKSDKVKVGALVGLGGMGKSSIARKWFDQIRCEIKSGTKVFWWGFYYNSSLSDCLNYLTEYIAGNKSLLNDCNKPADQINIIKNLIQNQVCLVVFDGFEEVQMRSALASHETDESIYKHLNELLKSFAESTGKSFLLVTTRYGLDGLNGYRSAQYDSEEIGSLSIEDAIEIFKHSHIRAEDNEIKTIWREFEGHALSLRLMTTLLQEYYNGDIHAIQEIPRLTSNDIIVYDADEIDGGKAQRILAWYDCILNEPSRMFLRIFSLFAKPVTQSDINFVFRKEDDRLKNESIVNLSNISFIKLTKKLIKLRLLAKRSDNEEKFYETHPLIKEYFSASLGKEARVYHQVLTEYYENHFAKSDYDLILRDKQIYHHAIRCKDYDSAIKASDRLLSNQYAVNIQSEAFGQLRFYRANSLPFAGTSYKEVYKKALKTYDFLTGGSIQNIFIRSLYFDNEKVDFAYFWDRTNRISHKKRMQRVRILPCAIELIRNSKIAPFSKHNPNKQFEIIHRFMGITKSDLKFYVHIMEDTSTSKMRFMSAFPVPSPKNR